MGLRGRVPQWELVLPAAQDPAVVLGQHRVPSRSPSEPAYSELQPGELSPGRSAVSEREADHAALQPAIIHLPSLGRAAWQADRLPPPARASPTTARSLPVGLPKRQSPRTRGIVQERSEEHTSELQSQSNLVCRLLLEKKKKKNTREQMSTQTL